MDHIPLYKRPSCWRKRQIDSFVPSWFQVVSQSGNIRPSLFPQIRLVEYEHSYQIFAFKRICKTFRLHFIRAKTGQPHIGYNTTHLIDDTGLQHGLVYISHRILYGQLLHQLTDNPNSLPLIKQTDFSAKQLWLCICGHYSAKSLHFYVKNSSVTLAYLLEQLVSLGIGSGQQHFGRQWGLVDFLIYPINQIHV
ncbi:hypothetical protein D3C81_1573980 [compost metagenome]